jgi:hypothetical protein
VPVESPVDALVLEQPAVQGQPAVVVAVAVQGQAVMELLQAVEQKQPAVQVAVAVQEGQ